MVDVLERRGNIMTSIQLCVYCTVNITGMSSRCSSNSEANASELLEHIEDMFPNTTRIAISAAVSNLHY